MVIQINIEAMLKAGLTGTQYMLLELLKVRNNKAIRKYINMDSRAVEDLNVLKKLGYILKMDKTGYLINHKQINQVIDLKDELFWEIFGMYPIKVYNGNVTRILRASSPDSKEAQECLKKYKSKVKTVEMHEHIVKCLNVELGMRTKEKNTEYMQKLVTWLNQSAWENYESFVTEAGNMNLENKESYGGGLI